MKKIMVSSESFETYHPIAVPDIPESRFYVRKDLQKKNEVSNEKNYGKFRSFETYHPIAVPDIPVSRFYREKKR
jgi:hypothetical protein